MAVLSIQVSKNVAQEVKFLFNKFDYIFIFNIMRHMSHTLNPEKHSTLKFMIAFHKLQASN